MGTAYTVQAIFEAVDNMTGTVDKIGGSLKNAGAAMQKTGAMMSAGLTAPLAILGKQSITTALEADRLTKTLTGLAGGADEAATYIDAIKEASQGTVPQVDALAIANRALSFGVVENADEMAKMTEIAIALGRAQGLDAATAVSDLTTALSRQSPMILDNLGITMKLSEAYAVYAEKLGKTVEELTAAEKGEAFRIAALEKGMEVVEQMGGVQDDAAGAMERMNAQISDAKLLIGNALLPILTPLLEKLTSAVEWFTSLDESTRGWIVKIGLVVAAAGPLLVILGTVVSAVGTLAGVVAGISAPILLVIAAIVALGIAFATDFGGIRTAVEQAWAAVQPVLMVLWQWLQEVIPQALAVLWQGFQAAWAFIQPILAELVAFAMEMLGKVVDWVVANWPLIQETISTILNAIWTVIQTVLGAIQAFWQTHGENILTYVTLAWENTKILIETVINVILGIIRAVMQAITGDWEGAWETIKGIGQTTWDAIKAITQNAIGMVEALVSSLSVWLEAMWNKIKAVAQTMWDAIKVAITDIVQSLAGWLETTWTLIQGAAEAAWENLKASVAATVQGVYDDVTGKIDEIKTWIGGQVTNFTTLGNDLIQGLIDGAGAMAGALVSAMTNLVDNAIDAILRALGIRSPSRVFKNIGAMAMTGFLEGITGMQDQVVGAVARAMGETVEVAGVYATRGGERAGTIYDNRRTTNNQSTVNVNGMGLGSILSLAAEQV